MMHWWHQWKLNRAIDDDPSGAAADAYAQRHPRCRQRKRTLDALEARLKADAPAWRSAAREDRRGIAPRRSHHSPKHLVGWSAIAAALVVGLTIALMLPGTQPIDDRPEPGTAMSVDFGAVVTRSTFAVQRPLDEEARRLADDTRAAARFAIDTLPTFGLNRRPTN